MSLPAVQGLGRAPSGGRVAVFRVLPSPDDKQHVSPKLWAVRFFNTLLECWAQRKTIEILFIPQSDLHLYSLATPSSSPELCFTVLPPVSSDTIWKP